ncbi:MAG: hypothetical protein AB1896_13145 [Thermodesulfobacteriota bacterium]
MELGFLPQAKKPGSTEEGLTSRKLADLIPYQRRPFTSLEIELTTRCNLFCPSCPRAVYSRAWIEQDMSLECFEKLLPVMEQFQTVHFRGWGEPVLNPFFPEMVRTAYQSGASLVLSSNGVKLPDLSLLPYFEAVTFRLDYGRASTYERRNPSARFNRVVFNLSKVLHWRDSENLTQPRLVILFAKNRYSLRDLPVYLETALRLRPDRVAFYRPLFHVRRVDAQGHLPGEVDPGLVVKIDQRLESAAREAGVDLVNQAVGPGQARDRCGFDSEKGLFVNWSGRAALCRYSALPVAHGTYTRFFPDGEKVGHTTLLENLGRKDLESLISSSAYRLGRRACWLRGGQRSVAGPSFEEQAPEGAGGKLIYLPEALARTGHCSSR